MLKIFNTTFTLRVVIVTDESNTYIYTDRNLDMELIDK